MRQKRTVFLSCIVILILCFFDNSAALWNGPKCLRYLFDQNYYPVSTWKAFDPIWGNELCSIGFIFKLTGILISMVGLYALFIDSLNRKWLRVTLLIFALLSITLTLPIYHSHPGLDGSHRHSFWNGGFHFH